MMYERHYQNRSIEWCRYSDHALKQIRPQKPYRFGRLLRNGFSRVTSYSNGHPYAVVHWNGLKTTSQYHADFIVVFARTETDQLPDIPQLPVWTHLLRSLAWRAF